MCSVGRLLDRQTPDLLPTDSLPPRAAAEVDYLAGRAGGWSEARDDVPAGIRARACVLAGDVDTARQLLATVDVDTAGAHEVAAAAWAASRVGPTSAVERLRARVDGLADGFLVDDGLPLGPTAQFAGLLAAAAGHLHTAARQLREAVEVADERAPMWGAIARLELARVLRCTAETGGRDHGDRPDEEWRRLGTAARTFFTAGGCAALGRRADEVLGTPRVRAVAEPGLGHLAQDGTDDAGEDRAGRWTVGFGVVPPVVVPARKGLVVLAELVDRGPFAVDAVDLERLLDGADRGTGDADPARARSRISKLVRRTIERLDAEHPLLAAHLSCSVETGYACRYVPRPGVVWRR